MQHDLKTKGSVIVMKYDEYLNACLKFAKDTENWSWLDRSRWFTTNAAVTMRNPVTMQTAAIDVAWAYKWILIKSASTLRRSSWTAVLSSSTWH